MKDDDIGGSDDGYAPEKVHLISAKADHIYPRRIHGPRERVPDTKNAFGTATIDFDHLQGYQNTEGCLPVRCEACVVKIFYLHSWI